MFLFWEFDIHTALRSIIMSLCQLNDLTGVPVLVILKSLCIWFDVIYSWSDVFPCITMLSLDLTVSFLGLKYTVTVYILAYAS